MIPTMLIVDDDVSFRLIAGELLATGGFDILGDARSGAEAIVAARDLQPDVVLLDVRLPDTDGFAIAKRLAQDGDTPRVVLCSVRAAEDYPLTSDECGAAGFLSKTALSAEAVRRLVVDPVP